VDADQVRVIDRVPRRVAETHILAAIDEQVVEAAQTRSPKQLQSWFLRLVVRLEPVAFEHHNRRAPWPNGGYALSRALMASAMSQARCLEPTRRQSMRC